jgi:CheY-like chemotaxis protein
MWAMRPVLVIEDDATLRQVLLDQLTAEGSFQPVEVATLAEAAAHLGKADARFDAILLDIALLDGDGCEFCALMRGQRHGMPVIMLTEASAQGTKAAAAGTAGLVAAEERIGTAARPSPPCRRDPSKGSRTQEGPAASDFAPADSQGRCVEGRDAERAGHDPEPASRLVGGRCRDVPAGHLLPLQGRVAGATGGGDRPLVPRQSDLLPVRRAASRDERPVAARTGLRVRQPDGTRPQRGGEPPQVSQGMREPER